MVHAIYATLRFYAYFGDFSIITKSSFLNEAGRKCRMRADKQTGRKQGWRDRGVEGGTGTEGTWK